MNNVLNMTQWLAALKSADTKKALPILSFPCVSKLNIPVSTAFQPQQATKQHHQLHIQLAHPSMGDGTNQIVFLILAIQFLIIQQRAFAVTYLHLAHNKQQQ